VRQHSRKAECSTASSLDGQATKLQISNKTASREQMHNNIKYRHPTLLQDARMKQGTKGDGTKAYELLLKVPRTPTFGISPEKKLVDRFLEMVKCCSSLRFTFNQHFVFQQGGA